MVRKGRSPSAWVGGGETRAQGGGAGRSSGGGPRSAKPGKRMAAPRPTYGLEGDGEMVFGIIDLATLG
jgi:hypothetical protein